ncbi:MAG: aminotransferase class I/II-fold pyridoxal phosphate-dependent enzyme [Deltaproteobacteria bacterium]|nr:aminotransferase class I/II-fold pyridoxal phosphate-dependent enzyme [Deltaproteobacteria bacterium]
MTRKLAPFGVSVFTEFTRLALEHQAINLAQGFPDFDGPDAIKEFACERIRRGHNQYAPSHGVAALRRAIAAKVQRCYGLEVDAEDEVTVYAGATEAIFSSLAGLIEPGDEVILFEPAYDSYAPSTVMAGGTPRYVTLRFPDFAVDEDELRAAFSPRTKAIVLNTPMNPCGKVFSRAELSLIAELCQQFDCFAVTDEVYEHLTFDGASHLPLIALPGMRQRTVMISSTAKTFSMTGWKVGYSVAGPRLTAASRSSHQFVTFCTPPPLQEAMAFAMGLGDEYFSGLRQSYAERRALLLERLAAIGFDVRPPAGTYYVAAGIGPLGFDDDYAFCRGLPALAGVSMIPFSAFYRDRHAGRDVVRVAFCKSGPLLEEACVRLGRLPRRS